MTTEPSIWLTRICLVLKLNRSSFYKWASTRERRKVRKFSEAAVGAKIRSIFYDEHGLYVAPTHRCSLERGHFKGLCFGECVLAPLLLPGDFYKVLRQLCVS